MSTISSVSPETRGISGQTWTGAADIAGMSETSRIGEGAFPAVMPEEPVAPQWERIALDSRRPWSFDDRGRVLRIVTGHVDVFAVRSGAGAERPRHHLFRLESGEIVMDLPGAGGAVDAVGVIAVGGPGAEVLMVPRESIGERALIETWIAASVRRRSGRLSIGLRAKPGRDPRSTRSR